MRCPRCQSENRDGRRYCRVCGLLLRILCEECGFDNLPGDSFCGGCGGSLLADPATLSPEDLPSSDPADLPSRSLSPEPNRLASLRAELPPAPTDSIDGLSDLDISELDDQFIEGEP